MSLGIIVTLLACMVQRLASSIRLTKNASAALLQAYNGAPLEAHISLAHSLGYLTD